MASATDGPAPVGSTSRPRDVGIVVDLGRSMFAKETPADVRSLVHELGRLFTIDVDDNWRDETDLRRRVASI